MPKQRGARPGAGRATRKRKSRPAAASKTARPGRPPIPLGGTADTRGQILQAAERLFAARGFDATTIKELGAEAGVNPALIYYYFGDKEQLHQAVINRFADELIERARSGISAARNPEEVIRAVVQAQTAMFSGYPDRARIMARELIDHDAAHAGEFLPRLSANVFQKLRAAIQEAQRTGRFREDFDPSYAAISIVSQVIYFHLARPIIRVLLEDRGPLGAREEEAFADHAASFALSALQRRRAR